MFWVFLSLIVQNVECITTYWPGNVQNSRFLSSWPRPMSGENFLYKIPYELAREVATWYLYHYQSFLLFNLLWLFISPQSLQLKTLICSRLFNWADEDNREISTSLHNENDAKQLGFKGRGGVLSLDGVQMTCCLTIPCKCVSTKGWMNAMHQHACKLRSEKG